MSVPYSFKCIRTSRSTTKTITESNRNITSATFQKLSKYFKPFYFNCLASKKPIVNTIMTKLIKQRKFRAFALASSSSLSCRN